jgi:hypothetical protein
LLEAIIIGCMAIKILPAIAIIRPFRLAQINMWTERASFLREYFYGKYLYQSDIITFFQGFIDLLVLPSWRQSLIYILQLIETVRAPVV